VTAAEAERQALVAATLSVFKKRPTIYFLYLGEKLIKSFAKPGDLSKHFKLKHHQRNGQPRVQGVPDASEE
jgi:hypothetical protein